MNEIKFFTTLIVWTRTTVLILSILIVLISLSLYDNLLSDPDSTAKSHQLITGMIQDRRLIATLVAAQASIFCPLFLLMSSPVESGKVWRILIEQGCQCLMPIGLGFSWVFCIAFDHKSAAYDRPCAVWLKYLIVGVLGVEVFAIWCLSFRYVADVWNQQSIRLEDVEHGLEEVEEKVVF